MKHNFIYLLLFLLCISCSSTNFGKDKEIDVHYQIVDRIISNPDSNFYAIINDTTYVHPKDYRMNFGNHESTLKFIRGNFQNGYNLKQDKLYDQLLNDGTVCKMHNIVIRSKSTKKYLTFAFWNRYHNKWKLKIIVDYYGPLPYPENDY